MAKVSAFPSKTARFAQIVEQRGRPSVHITFVDPQKDRTLQRLAKQDRVMTVHQTGHGADYGTVGLAPGRQAQLLVFPKSLTRYANRRIVGINYDLLDTSALLTAKPQALPARKRPKAKSPPHVRKTSPEKTPELVLLENELAGIRRDEEDAPLTWDTLLPQLKTIRRQLRGRNTATALRLLEQLIIRIHAHQHAHDPSFAS